MVSIGLQWLHELSGSLVGRAFMRWFVESKLLQLGVVKTAHSRQRRCQRKTDSKHDPQSSSSGFGTNLLSRWVMLGKPIQQAAIFFPMILGRVWHQAVALDDGRVVIGGGLGGSIFEIMNTK